MQWEERRRSSSFVSPRIPGSVQRWQLSSDVALTGASIYSAALQNSPKNRPNVSHATYCTSTVHAVDGAPRATFPPGELGSSPQRALSNSHSAVASVETAANIRIVYFGVAGTASNAFPGVSPAPSCSNNSPVSLHQGGRHKAEREQMS